MYVAVVTRLGETNSKRDDESWGAFIGNTQEKAINKAIKISELWSRNNGKTYDILVGKLTEKVVRPVEYELRPLEGERDGTNK